MSGSHFRGGPQGQSPAQSAPSPGRLRRQRQRRQILRSILSAMLTLLSVCVLLLIVFKFFFLRAPAQKPVDLPDLPPAEDGAGDGSPGGEDPQAALAAHFARKEGFYTILVSGTDNGNGNSDTNILIAADTKTGYVYGVSIPRDAKAVIDGKEQKINAAFGRGGREKLAEVVSQQLGIPIDYTVSVDLRGFVSLVDTIGGIDFYVPLDMDYDDPYQDLSIHFAKGMQFLNGEDALKVVRFRHNNDGTGYGSEDLGRMATQQKFLKAVAKKMLSLDNLVTKVPEYADIFTRSVDTDLTAGNLAWLGTEILKMGTDKIEFSTLPSQWRSPYIYLDIPQTLELINTYLNPYVEDRTEADLQIPS